jgi:hypothetical protein
VYESHHPHDLKKLGFYILSGEMQRNEVCDPDLFETGFFPN